MYWINKTMSINIIIYEEWHKTETKLILISIAFLVCRIKET